MEKNMEEWNKKIEEITDQLNENILAVKGTLELMDATVTEDDLSELLHKSIERTDIIQGLSYEILALLKNCLNKLEENKK
jgi:hypothetical protein